METPATAAKKSVSKEVAKEHIQSLMKYYRLDVKNIEIINGPEAVQTMLNGLVYAIQEGWLVIEMTPEFRVVQKLEHPIGDVKELRYQDKIGQGNVAMDGTPTDKIHTRKLEFFEVLTGVPSGDLMKLRGGDMTTYDQLATIFSMV